jgi:hypothetical protein
MLIDSIGAGTDAERIQSILLAHVVVSKIPGADDEFVKRFAAAVGVGILPLASTTNKKEKEQLIGAVVFARPSWANAFFADAIFTESGFVAVDALRGLVSSSEQRVSTILTSLEAAWQRVGAAQPAEQNSQSKRLIFALETLLQEITAEAQIDADATENLSRLVRAAGRRCAKGDIEKLADISLALSLEFARSRPTNALSFHTYTIVYAIKDSFSSLDWNRFVSKSRRLAAFVRSVRDAVGLLAGAGRVDEQLLNVWRAALPADDALTRELRAVAEEFRVAPEVRAMLLGERYVVTTHSATVENSFEEDLALMLREARRCRIALQQADDAALARLRVTDPAIHAELQTAHTAVAQLLQLVELAGHRRGLALVGDIGETVAFQPALHVNVLDEPVRTSRVRIRAPGVEHRERDDRVRVVVKADVQPVE